MTGRPDDTDDAPPPPFEDDDMFTHRERYQQERQRPRQGVADFVRRTIENTVGSMQSTGSISKDALSYLLQQGDRGKREIVRIVANEVGNFLRGVDLSGEIVKVLTSVQLEVKASVRFTPSGEKGVKPVVADSNVQLATSPTPAPAGPTPDPPDTPEPKDEPPPKSE